MRRIVVLGSLVLLLASAGDRARACSLVGAALLPTNYELVRAADAVVLARSAFDGKPAADPAHGLSIRFSIVDVLRGSFPERTLVLSGSLRFSGASPEEDFSRARPGAFAGACVAYDYRDDHLYVLFLDHDEKGVWVLDHVAFSRVNEEVAAPDSPWVKAVRAYSRIADLGDYEREKQALRELAKTSGPAIAHDIELHFRTATYAKSEADLLALYRAAKTDGQRNPAIWALARYGGAETAALFHGLLAAAKLPSELSGPAIDWARQQHVERELANILRHAEAQPKGQHWAYLTAIAELGGSDDLSTAEPFVLGLTDEELASMAEMAPWLKASTRTVAELRRRIGDAPRDQPRLLFLLADWGDQGVFDDALARLGAEGDRRWVDPYVVARSTRAEVPAALAKMLGTGDADLVGWFVEGLLESKRPDRLELLTTVLAKRPVPRQVAEPAFKALNAMRRQGVAGTDAVEAMLPP